MPTKFTAGKCYSLSGATTTLQMTLQVHLIAGCKIQILITPQNTYRLIKCFSNLSKLRGIFCHVVWNYVHLSLAVRARKVEGQTPLKSLVTAWLAWKTLGVQEMDMELKSTHRQHEKTKTCTDPKQFVIEHLKTYGINSTGTCAEEGRKVWCETAKNVMRNREI